MNTREALKQQSKKCRQISTPDLIIISAGFDSHREDPLGQLLLKDDDFVAMTSVMKQWAAETCHGRLVSCLEGGYNL